MSRRAAPKLKVFRVRFRESAVLASAVLTLSLYFIMPFRKAAPLLFIWNLVAIVTAFGMAWVAHRYRHHPIEETKFVDRLLVYTALALLVTGVCCMVFYTQ